MRNPHRTKVEGEAGLYEGKCLQGVEVSKRKWM